MTRWYGGPLIGVVHLPALPGSPGYGGDMGAVVERARRDAEAYRGGGAHGLVVENFGDAPFFGATVPAETVAAMTRAALAVAEAGLPFGINVLRNDAHAALAVAAATGAAFVRVNVHCGVVATDQGLLEGRAADTLRLRRLLGADTRIAADVHVKHGRALDSTDIGAAAHDTVDRGGADAIVVSGAATGAPTATAELKSVREAIGETPLLVGSGVHESNIEEMLRFADAVIVGTSLKRDGVTGNEVDVVRVRRLAQRI